MRISLGKVVLTGTGSALLLAPVLTGQLAATSARAPAATPAPARAAPVTIPADLATVRDAKAKAALEPFAAPTLHHGDHGAPVRQLQQRLTDLGYDPGRVDGEWGDATRFAVWAFQKVNHIKPSSTFGAKSWAALAMPRTPEPLVPKGAKSRAEVDLKHQLLFVYKSGRLDLTSHISSGTGQRYSSGGHTGIAHTPRGSFKVYRKASGWERSPLGVLYKANYFDGGYAIHGEPAVPLHPASHGCVRVPMTTSNLVAKLLPLGTRVYVRG